jgi:hypothetical protein
MAITQRINKNPGQNVRELPAGGFRRVVRPRCWLRAEPTLKSDLGEAASDRLRIRPLPTIRSHTSIPCMDSSPSGIVNMALINYMA